MGFGDRIRRTRKQLRLTQQDLGREIGATDGYVSHLENELKVPSLELALAVARALQFSPDEQRDFLEQVDAARIERSRRRIQKRGEVLRQAIGGTGNHTGSDSIAAAIAADPALHQAHRDLLIVFADPQLRDAAVKTLRSLAQTARSA